MKFACINTFYHYGSTGRGVERRYNLLRDMGHEVRVYYGRQKQENAPEGVVYINNPISDFISVKCSRYLGLSGMLSIIPTWKLIRSLKKFKPDVVWLSNIHGSYVNEYWLLTFLKKTGIWTVYGLPDEYAYLGKCCNTSDCDKYTTAEGCHHCNHLREYPESYFFDNSRLKFQLKKKCYDGFERLVLRSAPYLMSNARRSTLLRGKETVDTDSFVDIAGVFYPRDAAELRKKLGIGEDQRVMLLCAPVRDPKKGGKYFLEAAKRCLDDNIIFVNPAYGGDESLCPPNYIPLPYITDLNELAILYSMADAYVCTSLADAQPNTCLEAMGCGTKIIGFNISGTPYVAPPEFGTFVTPENIDELVEAIRNTERKTEMSIQACHEYARNRFDTAVGNRRQAEFINEMCKRAQCDRRTYKL